MVTKDENIQIILTNFRLTNPAHDPPLPALRSYTAMVRSRSKHEKPRLLSCDIWHATTFAVLLNVCCGCGSAALHFSDKQAVVYVIEKDIQNHGKEGSFGYNAHKMTRICRLLSALEGTDSDARSKSLVLQAPLSSIRPKHGKARCY